MTEILIESKETLVYKYEDTYHMVLDLKYKNKTLDKVLLPRNYMDNVITTTLDIGGNTIYTVNTNDLLEHDLNKDKELVDVLSLFLRYLPISNLPYVTVELKLKLKNNLEITNTVTREHKQFKYEHFDADYDRDFGYNPAAYSTTTTKEEYAMTPELTLVVIEPIAVVLFDRLTIPLINNKLNTHIKDSNKELDYNLHIYYGSGGLDRSD